MADVEAIDPRHSVPDCDTRCRLRPKKKNKRRIIRSSVCVISIIYLFELNLVGGNVLLPGAVIVLQAFHGPQPAKVLDNGWHLSWLTTGRSFAYNCDRTVQMSCYVHGSVYARSSDQPDVSSSIERPFTGIRAVDPHNKVVFRPDCVHPATKSDHQNHHVCGPVVKNCTAQLHLVEVD